MGSGDASDQPNINQSELKEKAFEIYRQLSQQQSARSPEQLAIQAHRLAKDFLEVNAKIESGEINPTPIHPKPERVKVPRMYAKNENQGFETVKDPVTGADVMDDAPVDHYAFAPNLPENHSINLRFKSPEGVKVRDLIEEHKRSVLVGSGRN